MTEAICKVVQNNMDPDSPSNYESNGYKGDTCLPLDEGKIIDNTYNIDFIEEDGTYDHFLSVFDFNYDHLTGELTLGRACTKAEDPAFHVAWQGSLTHM